MLTYKNVFGKKDIDAALLQVGNAIKTQRQGLEADYAAEGQRFHGHSSAGRNRERALDSYASACLALGQSSRVGFGTAMANVITLLEKETGESLSWIWKAVDDKRGELSSAQLSRLGL